MGTCSFVKELPSNGSCTFSYFMVTAQQRVCMLQFYDFTLAIHFTLIIAGGFGMMKLEGHSWKLICYKHMNYADWKMSTTWSRTTIQKNQWKFFWKLKNQNVYHKTGDKSLYSSCIVYTACWFNHIPSEGLVKTLFHLQEFYFLEYNTVQSSECQLVFHRNLSPPTSGSMSKPSKIPADADSRLILWPWKLGQYVPLKCQLTFIGLHNIISCKT
jgi:hypothetical protein